jgi:hypothetical protein
LFLFIVVAVYFLARETGIYIYIYINNKMYRCQNSKLDGAAEYRYGRTE